MLESALAAVTAILTPSALSPTALVAEGDPRVLLTASTGSIKLGLNGQKAPALVQSFIDYINNGSHNSTTFHHMAPGFIVWGSDFIGQMQQKRPSPLTKNEVDNGLRSTRGTITMACIADKDSVISQFFINIVDDAFLDYGQHDFGYTALGRAVKGMDAVDKTPQVQTHDIGPYQNIPSKPIVILSAKVLP